MEAQIDYQFTPKTSIILKASRRTNETNIAGTDFVLSNTVELQYLQKLTGKITADVKLAYTNDNYRGKVTFKDLTGNLKDNYYMGVFALRYKFKEWLQMDLGYIFDKRDSKFLRVRLYNEYRFPEAHRRVVGNSGLINSPLSAFLL